MKKSEIVYTIDITRMAEEFKLPESDIKVALTWSEPKMDTSSISRIANIGVAKRLYKKTKNIRRRRAIAERALDFCNTFDELELWRVLMFDDQSPVLNGLYTRKLRAVAIEAIQDASTFDEVHSVWLKCYDEALGAEDLLAYQKLRLLATLSPVTDVLNTFLSHVGIEILAESSQQYDILVLACAWASPESAIEALRSLRDHGWNGEQDTYPVMLLIQKASQLYCIK